MAGLQERSGSYRILFRFHSKQYVFTLGKVSKQEAETKSAQVDYLLLRLKQRLIELPAGVDIVDFLRFDGKPRIKEGEPALVVTKATTLETLRDCFLATHATAHEKNTLGTARIHFNHLIKTLGRGFPLPELTQTNLQRYIEKRSGEGVKPVTVRKEIQGLHRPGTGVGGGDWSPGNGPARG